MKLQNIRNAILSLAVITISFGAFAQGAKNQATVSNSSKFISNSQVGATKALGDTVLFEDFNAGIPSSWTLINYDSLTPQPGYAPIFGDTAWVSVNWNGTADPVASSTSWYSPAGQANDWMIFQVTLPNANTTLKWEAAASDAPPFNDGYDVYVATQSDTASLVANGPVFSTVAESPSGNFVTRQVDLDTLGFINQTVFVAFRNRSADANLLWIDNVLVFESAVQVQIVHNSADLAAGLVDLYVDNALALDSVAFRSATGFLTLPDSFNIKVSPTGAGIGAAVYDQDIDLISGKNYIAIAAGIVDTANYTPAPAFDIYGFEDARATSDTVTQTDVLVFHGSTDAPAVTVNELSVPVTLVPTASFGDYAGYLSLTTADYVLSVTDSANVTLYYGAPLQTLGLGGAAITVVASGFVDPAQNNNGAGFGLFAVLPTGGALVPLPELDAPKVQIIHNSADLAADTVDVFVEGNAALPGVAFRNATGFISLPHNFVLDIAPNGAGIGSSVFNAPISLLPGEKYIVIANGIVDTANYTPAPAFGLDVFGLAREEADTAGNTDVLVYHGSTDAPTVDINETSVPAGTLVPGISYGEFASDYLELATADYVVEVTDNGAVSLEYQAPLSTLNLDDSALVVLASGFVDPAVNNNGAGFGLFVALPVGGELIPLPLVTGLDNEAFKAQFNIYPNPAADAVTVDFGEVNVQNVRIVNILGQAVKTFELNGVATQTFDVSDVESGTYFIQIEGDSQIGSIPVVIQ